LDEDCDGTTDEDYVVDASCGIGECQTNNTPSSCLAGVESVCTPGTAAADDTVCDGLDEDCDGSADEDYTVTATTCGLGECAGNAGQLECQGGAETDTCDPLAGAATETCDNLDNNCDGTVDEGLTTIYYQDSDHDNYGNPAVPENACTEPVDYVLDNTDCDDTDPAINPETYWYPDSDGDGYGNPTVSLQQCLQLAGYVLDNLDCNDNDANLYPGGQPVRVVGTATIYYTTLQDAYTNINTVDGDLIQSQDVTFNGGMTINLDKSVVIEGGYDCAYSVITGVTTINGNVTITDGSVTIENFVIQLPSD
jgi:hypothetical protein